MMSSQNLLIIIYLVICTIFKMPSFCFNTRIESFPETQNRFLDRFFWQIVPYFLQSRFQLSYVSWHRIQPVILFQHGSPDMIVEGIEVWTAWRPGVFVNEVGTVFRKPFLCDLCSVSWRAILLKYEFVLKCCVRKKI